jgi:methylaspartate mutase epsilon subunit
VRDGRGALRYLDHGDMPLPQAVIDYHRSRIAERANKEGTQADLSWVIREATWASRPLTEEAAERSY